MNILFFTDNFPPEVNAPASRTFEHCRQWVVAGHGVTVITGVPNFPGGKVYEGYRNRLWQRETIDGIRVVRVWTYIAANAGFGKRILDYMSFMVSSFLASLFTRRADIAVGTSPQFFTVCAAYMASLFKGIPFVFELRDLWPESIRAVGALKADPLIRAIERIELFLYRRAALIVSVTRSFRRKLIARGVSAEKIAVVTNGVDMTRFKPMEKDAELVAYYGLEGKFVAGYIGTLGMAHGLETVLDAAALMRQMPEGHRFSFILLGDGARKAALQQRAEKTGLDNLVFINSVPKKDVPRYWSLLDVSIIHLKKTELFTTVIPSKLFECMGMGIPVLHGVAGESADIVTHGEVGIVFEPENVAQLCHGLIRLEANHDLYRRLHRQCLKSAVRYDRTRQASSMLSLLYQVYRSGRIRNPNATMSLTSDGCKDERVTTAAG